MTYRYQDHHAWLFSDEGQRALLKLRDWVFSTLRVAGALQVGKAMEVVRVSNSQQFFALVDRLVELGEIEEIPGQTCFSQHRVYIGKGSPR